MFGANKEVKDYQAQKKKIKIIVRKEKEELLRQRLEQQSIQKEQALKRRQEAKQTFRLKAASFELNSSHLSAQAKLNIANIAKEIKKIKYKFVTAEGHTDSTGGDDQNTVLSQFRAQAVAHELLLNGIPKEKIRFIGLGSSIPISDNMTPAGREKNRRAEIFVE
jgi:outer membrane protein OmpA-like peptidoglycan-associated protein